MLRPEAGELAGAADAMRSAGRTFIAGEPMKVATKTFAGRVYSSSGVPICWRTPFLMTAIRSPIVIASTWSWVT